MLLMAIGEAVKAHLDTLSLGANVYIGAVRPSNGDGGIPHKAVFILETGGPMPTPYMDGSTTAYRKCRVQIRVRGQPNDYAAGRDLANSIWSGLQQTTAITGAYTRVTCDQSLPMYMGQDAFQCPEWSVNATLEREF